LREEKQSGGLFFSKKVRKTGTECVALGRRAGQIAEGKVRPATQTKKGDTQSSISFFIQSEGLVCNRR